MTKVAFELRENVEDFNGGTVSLPDGSAFDVGEALKDGGKIVLDPDQKDEGKAKADADISEALSRFPALKTTTVAAKSTASTSKGANS